MLRNISVCLAIVFLASACSARVDVPHVTVEGVGKPLKGNYAALVQTGGWDIKAENVGFTCGAWSFDVDLNDKYADALKEALTKSLEKVSFVSSPISDTQIGESGYDAQIVIYQSGAKATYGVNPGWFSATITSEVKLESILAVVDGDGLSYQKTILSSGTGMAQAGVCPSAGDAVGLASQSAIRDVAENTTLYIRDALRDRNDKKAVPSS